MTISQLKKSNHIDKKTLMKLLKKSILKVYNSSKLSDAIWQI